MKYEVKGKKIIIDKDELEKLVATLRCQAGSARTLEMEYYCAGKADAFDDLIRRIENENS